MHCLREQFRTKYSFYRRRHPDALGEAAEVIRLKKGLIIQRRQKLGPPKPLTGTERRRINPNHGLVKLFERNMDRLVSRFLYPHLSAIWSPYTWIIERRFRVAETVVSPAGWPRDLPPTRVLLLSDIHCGIFLKPETLAEIVKFLMQLGPDLVAVTGDIVTGHSREVQPFLNALAPLSRAPLGAWFCFGNHDYFGGDPEEIREGLHAAGIGTLKNESVRISHGPGSFLLGGIDDLILGKPDWARLMSSWRTIPITFTTPKPAACRLSSPGTPMAVRFVCPMARPSFVKAASALTKAFTLFGHPCW
jgi:hypothetical protein